MITEFRLQNFKSWADSGPLRLAPITGIFGANSSGKSSLLQFLLLIKQTVESRERGRPLLTTDVQNRDRLYTDAGQFESLLYNNKKPLAFELVWQPHNVRTVITNFENHSGTALEKLGFKAELKWHQNRVVVQAMEYEVKGTDIVFGMTRVDAKSYRRIWTGFPELILNSGLTSFAPEKHYAFPSRDILTSIEPDLVSAYEELFSQTYYLGPLREPLSRRYVWEGEIITDIGNRGENAMRVILAGRDADGASGLEIRIAEDLKELGLIHSFRTIRLNRGAEYEVRVRQSKGSAEVLITDVGFGVSQILPVLVLCYYVPRGATIIFEQPELHLHPAVQSGLADLFIRVAQERDVQIIVESHSEHLLRRLQRRIAEEKITTDEVALYFTCMENGVSRAETLELDEYGNIRNWPTAFFGDEMGDIAAAATAEMERRLR